MSPAAAIQNILDGGGDLPVLPEMAGRILEEIRSPDASAARLAEFVKKDPVLASSVLRVANSALYGGRIEITDLAYAMTRIGLNQVRNLVMATLLRSRMADPEVYGPRGPMLMDHCLAVAFGAQLVADATGQPTDEAFLCGLLHDFGKLALVKALREARGLRQGELPEEDLALVDVHHPAAGGMLAEEWGLPEIVALVTRQHHRLEHAQEAQAMTAVVAFADGMAHRLGLGVAPKDDLDLAAHPAVAIIRLPQATIDDLLENLPGLCEIAGAALKGTPQG
jgi:putative nucleotidyltransferase with HDIG domain